MLKPSEHASVTCLLMAQLAHEVGVPAGVLNVVSGLGTIAGAALARHPRLAKLAFTGSNATGRVVARAAAENLVPCTLELGGKSALIVFDDADIDKAVEWAMVCSACQLAGLSWRHLSSVCACFALAGLRLAFEFSQASVVHPSLCVCTSKLA